ncbi:MAG TPA: hypothetical protein VHN14_06775 [Kofleriaceae bacterium]|jgi:hypothetical protein|nr:hypothetical protein [Kofleriaceae bacterium]
MTHEHYEAKPGVLVLSADLVGGFVPPDVQINHVTLTKIYGDGKVVFVDPAKGPSEICQGHLDAKKITQLFDLLQAKGFFEFSDSYFTPGPTDMPTTVVTATRRGKQEKQVGAYGGALSAPPGFMDCYHALLYPQIQPSDIKKYVRKPISAEELAAGHYHGFEYQKKLNTPQDWVWVDAGRNSQWHRPEAQTHTVALDSGFMIPPVDNCRHIRISYTTSPMTAGSMIQYDRNSMSPNEFGDVGVTTRVYYAPRLAHFTLIETKGDKHLFSIAVPGTSGTKLRLVVIGDLARPSGGRLLALDDHAAIQHIYPLEFVAEK